MSKVTAPLLSFSASGQIAKTMVYSEWKGVPYLRRYVIPANPRSSEQTLTRNLFGWLNNVWRIAPANFVAPWNAAAAGRPLTGRNLLIQHNIPVLRELTVATGMVMSPGAKAGLAATVTITPGDDQLTFAASAPDPLPSGWSIVKLVGVAIKQQDPQTDADYEVFAVEDTTSAYSVVMSGLESATAYVAAGWFVYQRSALANDLAYGYAVGAQYTTT